MRPSLQVRRRRVKRRTPNRMTIEQALEALANISVQRFKPLGRLRAEEILDAVKDNYECGCPMGHWPSPCAEGY